MSSYKRWLSDHLHMGPPGAVGRYVGEAERDERVEAVALVEALTTKFRG